jgi:hypothetical protein
LAYTHCSYAYHHPFGTYALTTSSEPGFAVAADRNPWIESPAAAARVLSYFTPDISPYSGTSEKARQGNCNAHQLDGQNVLFLDSHVTFEKRAYCSVEDDNIYTVSGRTATGDSLGSIPTLTSVPLNRKDCLAVHDPSTISSGGGGTGGGR